MEMEFGRSTREETDTGVRTWLNNDFDTVIYIHILYIFIFSFLKVKGNRCPVYRRDTIRDRPVSTFTHTDTQCV